MLVRMNGLLKRGGVWIYRRSVPEKLRPMVGAREIKRSLGTADLTEAQARWAKVKAQVDAQFAAAAGTSPAAVAYHAVQSWTEGDAGAEEALDSHLTMVLERGGIHLDPVRRAMLEGLLKRQEHGGADNPPLSVLFGRYSAERKLPAKTELEWDGVLKRFVAVAGDVPVRDLTQAHVRGFKTALLAAPGRLGRPLAGATVKKTLGALASVLSWAKREGHIETNPAEGITVIAKDNHEDRRLPYDAADLKRIFGVTRDAGANHWLPYLALYTGARLEELGQLRTADVREEDGVPYIAIEAGDGKHIKNRGSKRRVPIHPELVRLGFLDFARAATTERLFPELKATRFSLTAAWSKWWGMHARRVCGISDTRKTFHSFRHGWKDAARAVMPEEHHDAITGHSSGSVGRSYGRGVPLTVLAESMAKVRFRI